MRLCGEWGEGLPDLLRAGLLCNQSERQGSVTQVHTHVFVELLLYGTTMNATRRRVGRACISPYECTACTPLFPLPSAPFHVHRSERLDATIDALPTRSVPCTFNRLATRDWPRSKLTNRLVRDETTGGLAITRTQLLQPVRGKCRQTDARQTASHWLHSSSFASRRQPEHNGAQQNTCTLLLTPPGVLLPRGWCEELPCCLSLGRSASRNSFNQLPASHARSAATAALAGLGRSWGR